MTEFYDTSVLVASFLESHLHHEPSLDRFTAADRKRSFCSVHSLAELYSTLTKLPVKPRIAPEQALLFISDVRARLTLVALTAEDYFDTLGSAAELGISGGRIYDALLLRCAKKSGAQVIYTWNLGHFQQLAPELAQKIRTP